MLNRLLRYFIG